MREKKKKKNLTGLLKIFQDFPDEESYVCVK